MSPASVAASSTNRPRVSRARVVILCTSARGRAGTSARPRCGSGPPQPRTRPASRAAGRRGKQLVLNSRQWRVAAQRCDDGISSMRSRPASGPNAMLCATARLRSTTCRTITCVSRRRAPRSAPSRCWTRRVNGRGTQRSPLAGHGVRRRRGAPQRARAPQGHAGSAAGPRGRGSTWSAGRRRRRVPRTPRFFPVTTHPAPSIFG
jgi:hypothetical protein